MNPDNGKCREMRTCWVTRSSDSQVPFQPIECFPHIMLFIRSQCLYCFTDARMQSFVLCEICQQDYAGTALPHRLSCKKFVGKFEDFCLVCVEQRTNPLCRQCVTDWPVVHLPKEHGDKRKSSRRVLFGVDSE